MKMVKWQEGKKHVHYPHKYKFFDLLACNELKTVKTQYNQYTSFIFTVKKKNEIDKSKIKRQS